MDLIIRRTAQIDLSDNEPQQNSDDIVSEWIDSNCPDWNKADTRKTYVIPPTFPDINKKMDERGQLTEKHVFDILEEFGDKTGQPMIVIHSYKFSELIQNFEKGILKFDFCHGETDFVIVHRTLGVIFLQVKAAIKTAHKYGDAKKQLDKDWMAMTRSLRRLCLEDRLGTTVEAELAKCQGFVVMPNCPKDKALGKEGCFREDIQSVADFEKWWQENVHRTGVAEFSDDMYKLMAIRFVHARISTESCLLKDVIDETQRRIMLWTEDQLKIMTEDVPKQYIAGPAGSGKTLLLLKKAKQVAGKLKANERILIMCFNKPLKCFFEAEFRNFPTAGQIEVRTFVKILQEITGTRYLPEYDDEKFELVLDCIQNLYRMQSNPDLRMRNRYKYEHVFVDEGQDMYGMWMNLVNHMHDDDDVSNEEKRYKYRSFRYRDEASRSTRQSTLDNLIIPRPQLEVYRRSLRYSGATVWNSLPPHVRAAQSLGTFRSMTRNLD
ncbi:hypothetical protein Bbelb_300760 [Branchiostoma belcheri]|nr:hypothetical protein Bbelb_300760 [Branchiostoma belcheri]